MRCLPADMSDNGLSSSDQTQPPAHPRLLLRIPTGPFVDRSHNQPSFSPEPNISLDDSVDEFFEAFNDVSDQLNIELDTRPGDAQLGNHPTCGANAARGFITHPAKSRAGFRTEHVSRSTSSTTYITTPSELMPPS